MNLRQPTKKNKPEVKQVKYKIKVFDQKYSRRFKKFPKHVTEDFLNNTLYAVLHNPTHPVAIFQLHCYTHADTIRTQWFNLGRAIMPGGSEYTRQQSIDYEDEDSSIEQQCNNLAMEFAWENISSDVTILISDEDFKTTLKYIEDTYESKTESL